MLSQGVYNVYHAVIFGNPTAAWGDLCVAYSWEVDTWCGLFVNCPTPVNYFKTIGSPYFLN